MAFIVLWNPIPTFGRKHNYWNTIPPSVAQDLISTTTDTYTGCASTYLFLLPLFVSHVGQWSITGMVLAVKNSTTLRWTLGVLVQHLTLLRGLDPHLPMRLPSRPRAAPRTCGVHTQTHIWRQSPCSDSQERSVLRCDAGRCLSLHQRKTPLRLCFAVFWLTASNTWSMLLSLDL